MRKSVIIKPKQAGERYRMLQTAALLKLYHCDPDALDDPHRERPINPFAVLTREEIDEILRKA